VAPTPDPTGHTPPHRRRADRAAALIVDCHDPERLAGFWCGLLGLEIVDRIEDPPRYVDCSAIAGDLYLGFQRVPEAKVVKNRVHLDLDVGDVDATTRWVEDHGGSRVGDVDEPEYRLRVMRDPEGNEFCIWFPDP
jgi:predicted enzyme related to lactoylglutathione lyase